MARYGRGKPFGAKRTRVYGSRIIPRPQPYRIRAIQQAVDRAAMRRWLVHSRRTRPHGGIVAAAAVFPHALRRTLAVMRAAQTPRWLGRSRRLHAAGSVILGKAKPYTARRTIIRVPARFRILHSPRTRAHGGTITQAIFPKAIRRWLGKVRAKAASKTHAGVRRPAGSRIVGRARPYHPRTGNAAPFRGAQRGRWKPHSFVGRPHGGTITSGAPTTLRHRVSDIESAHIATTLRASRLQSDIESAGRLSTTRATPKVAEMESSGKSSTTVEGS